MMSGRTNDGDGVFYFTGYHRFAALNCGPGRYSGCGIRVTVVVYRIAVFG